MPANVTSATYTDASTGIGGGCMSLGNRGFFYEVAGSFRRGVETLLMANACGPS